VWLDSPVLLALSTGHKVGLAVVGGVFILFALGSSFLFPRFRPQFPGNGLRAFIVICFVFFFGMLGAVEVFGAEPKEHKEAASTAETTTEANSTTEATTTQATTTAPNTPPAPAPQVVQVTEKEFKIILASTTLKAGTVTFQIKNTGAIAHDLAVVGGPKTSLIQPKGTGTLTVKLKPGTTELYCSVPGHRAAGMDLKVKVSVASSASAKKKPGATTAKPTSVPQTVDVTEKEFKIILATPTLKAGTVTFKIKNTGALPHDLAVVGGPKSSLIQPGKTGTLTATLKAGTVELYCSVPGHKAAGMDLKVTVS
jgi:uncharacterized cupredoxin-like copper-binding protein